jgi:hypothetical protein
MTKITEPKSLTRKQFEHTIWFLHHLHAHNLIDHPLLITLLQHAGATYGAGETAGCPPHPPSLTENAADVAEVPKPKRTYKKKVVVATSEVPSVAGATTFIATQSHIADAVGTHAPPFLTEKADEVPKPKRVYKKKVVVATSEVHSVAGETVGCPPHPPSLTENAKEDEPERKGVVGVPTKSAICDAVARNVVSPTVKSKRTYKKKSVSGDVQQDIPERKGVCSINDLIKNVLLQGDGSPPCDPPAQNIQQNAQVECLAAADGNLCEEPLIIVHPCADGGYIDSGNNIHHF